ncbi:hypothetical protein [Nonlabens xiamenensis]|uniref:hypothetical protein n=1 Tax=Nonlabens xiamenensis TaxID=2341043 RepID=UPI000F609941|nr:hypothetical protein [Nonlabens xiamenensis]
MKKYLLLLFLFSVGLAYSQEETAEEPETAPYDFLDIFDPSRRDKEKIRTRTRLTVDAGFTQALGDGNGIGEDYQFFGSGIFGVALEFHTRLQPENDKVRFVYGLGLSTHILNIKDNQGYFTQNNITNLEPIGINTDRSQFVQTSLVAPLYIEFGSRKLQTYKDGLKRYHQDKAFVVGLGGYLGYVTTSSQVIKFDREGRDVTSTLTNDFEVNNFTYGLSAYAGYDDVQLFVQYGLNNILDGSPLEQKYVSIGFRLR